MLAPNWEDHDLETCPIINYFSNRNHTELVLKQVEEKIKKKCFYCQECKNCKTFKEYLKVFKQNGFWTFNKILGCGMFMTRSGVKKCIFKNCST